MEGSSIFSHLPFDSPTDCFKKKSCLNNMGPMVDRMGVPSFQLYMCCDLSQQLLSFSLIPLFTSLPSLSVNSTIFLFVFVLLNSNESTDSDSLFGYFKPMMLLSVKWGSRGEWRLCGSYFGVVFVCFHNHINKK